jgi:3-methyladenine DNA glycosylase AlkD
MNAEAIMQGLENLGNEKTKKILIKHGAREPFYGVKTTDLKKIQKKIKTDHNLEKELYDTGNSDAMYLACLIADPVQMSRADLDSWANKAYWYMLSEYAIASLASKSDFGLESALSWIESEQEMVATAGWSTLSNLLAIKPEDFFELELLTSLLNRVESTIHNSPNRVRYSMNGFVISLGVYISALTEKAMNAAGRIGKVKVDMGGTACKVPIAKEYIQKARNREYSRRRRTKG